MGPELIVRASQISPVVILTAVLVLAGLRPRPASGVRYMSFATLMAALLAAVFLAIEFIIGVFFPGCTFEASFAASCDFPHSLAYTLVPVILLLYAASMGLCLLTAFVAGITLARWWRWGQLLLVGAFGVLPLAYIGAIWEFFRLATGGPVPSLRPYLSLIGNSVTLTATLALLPILIYGLFFYAFPGPVDQPINGTTSHI